MPLGKRGDFRRDVVQGGQGGLLRGFALTGDRRGLLIDGVSGLQIEQVRTDGVRELAIAAKQSVGLVLHEVTLSKTRPDSAGKFGLGLLLVEASAATGTRQSTSQDQGYRHNENGSGRDHRLGSIANAP